MIVCFYSEFHMKSTRCLKHMACLLHKVQIHQPPESIEQISGLYPRRLILWHSSLLWPLSLSLCSPFQSSRKKNQSLLISNRTLSSTSIFPHRLNPLIYICGDGLVIFFLTVPLVFVRIAFGCICLWDWCAWWLMLDSSMKLKGQSCDQLIDLIGK